MSADVAISLARIADPWAPTVVSVCCTRIVPASAPTERPTMITSAKALVRIVMNALRSERRESTRGGRNGTTGFALMLAFTSNTAGGGNSNCSCSMFTPSFACVGAGSCSNPLTHFQTFLLSNRSLTQILRHTQSRPSLHKKFVTKSVRMRCDLNARAPQAQRIGDDGN